MIHDQDSTVLTRFSLRLPFAFLPLGAMACLWRGCQLSVLVSHFSIHKLLHTTTGVWPARSTWCKYSVHKDRERWTRTLSFGTRSWSSHWYIIVFVEVKVNLRCRFQPSIGIESTLVRGIRHCEWRIEKTITFRSFICWTVSCTLGRIGRPWKCTSISKISINHRLSQCNKMGWYGLFMTLDSWTVRTRRRLEKVSDIDWAGSF